MWGATHGLIVGMSVGLGLIEGWGVWGRGTSFKKPFGYLSAKM